MSAGTSFEKYQGIGNDFIIVERAESFDEERVRHVCDRHFGVGADGILVVGPGRTAGARASMIVQNADGSRPEMCGNGLRCVALHLARAAGVDRAEYIVDTDSGPKRCVVEREADAGRVLIDLGRAEPLPDFRTEIDGKAFSFRRIVTGNPHAIFLEGMFAVGDIDRIGPEVSRQIPGGANVEFVRANGPRSFDVVVWERGVGRTLACGTGAAATAAALAIAGRAPFGAPIEICLPGGPLEVTVEEGSLALTLRGPADYVFSGQF
jgi:diaminopimelate epimerase